MKRISEYNDITNIAENDVVPIVDVSDTTQATTGSTRKGTIEKIADYLKARTETLTNKTLTSPVINTPTGDVATITGTQTLTNKTLSGADNTLSDIKGTFKQMVVYTSGSGTYTVPSGVSSLIVECVGGGGGGGGGNGTSAATGVYVLGGSASGGDLNVAGGSGDGWVRISGAVGFTGKGGDSLYGLGGGSRGNGGASGNGLGGSGYGAGGSGGAAFSYSAHRTGGSGSNGIIIIYEYY